MHRTIRLTLLLFTLLAYSCRVQETMESIDPVSQEITIDEAKAFINSQKAGARLASGTTKVTRTEYWKDAQKMSYSNGWPVVVVPLSYNYQQQTAFIGKTPGKSDKINKDDWKFQSKLFIYKDRDGNILADVVRIIPTEADRKANKKVKGETFTGYVLAFDQTETKVMGGWYYEKGKAKKRTHIRSLKNARIGGVSECEVAIYSPATGSEPSSIGTGDTSPTANYYDAQGQLWVVNSTVTIDGCEQGANTSEPSGNNPPNNNLNLESVTWFLNTFGSSNGGNTGGGGVSTNESPYLFAMLTDGGVVGYSPIDNFFYAMENEKGITFSYAEKQLIQNDWSTWGMVVNGYVAATGQKPDLSAFALNISTASTQEILNAAMRLMVEEDNLNLLPPEERRLLGQGTSNWRRNCELYLSDARRATIRAILFYGYVDAQDNGNSIANAFKHAMFACYHAESFGRSLAEQICEAHEGGSVFLDSQMDRWNNAQGFRYWDTGERDMDRLSGTIYQATVRGELKWIKNGALIPTN